MEGSTLWRANGICVACQVDWSVGQDSGQWDKVRLKSSPGAQMVKSFLGSNIALSAPKLLVMIRLFQYFSGSILLLFIAFEELKLTLGYNFSFF